jgi:hypothetical protein
MLNVNRRLAESLWGKLPRILSASLRDLTIAYGFSLGRGDLTCLDGRWYVTHAGLLRLAERRRCAGIQVEAVSNLCDAQISRWIFKATVSLPNRGGVFVGYGDADQSNVSPLLRGAEMRVAETRAVNRALRKAYGIGLCSVEELGSASAPFEKISPQRSNGIANANGNGNGSKVRDRLCQVIRQYKLDPELVKAYAIDYCGTKTLKDAAREQVENFVRELADWAEKDRNGLICRLNGYAQPRQEVIA